MILKCDCKHEYQDKKYGEGKRVHNPFPDNNGTTSYRCTICGKGKSKENKKRR